VSTVIQPPANDHSDHDGTSSDPVRADELAVSLLGDVRTKLGGLHIAHARRVADQVRSRGDDRLVVVALLHDVVEKERCTLADLQAVFDDQRLVALVDMLTRRDAESDEEYLARCAADPEALLVKRADLADKDFRDDVGVPLATAQRLRRRAKERLALLDQLADWTHR
jgi:(p)ppGpp synthase/HD superfamily hydrolase